MHCIKHLCSKIRHNSKTIRKLGFLCMFLGSLIYVLSSIYSIVESKPLGLWHQKNFIFSDILPERNSTVSDTVNIDYLNLVHSTNCRITNPHDNYKFSIEYILQRIEYVAQSVYNSTIFLYENFRSTPKLNKEEQTILQVEIKNQFTTLLNKFSNENKVLNRMNFKNCPMDLDKITHYKGSEELKVLTEVEQNLANTLRSFYDGINENIVEERYGWIHVIRSSVSRNIDEAYDKLNNLCSVIVAQAPKFKEESSSTNTQITLKKCEEYVANSIKKVWNLDKKIF